MFNFIIQIILTMVVQLALLFRLINRQYRLNNDRKFVNVYIPEDHEEVLNEFLDDINDVLPNQNHASTEIAVLHNDELSNVPFPPIGIIGLTRYGYIFQNKEDERIYDMKFIEASKTANDIFLEV
ncbi:PREDICTED: uncharacterized protein LOC107171221 [Diuraphis noxia]|uniref:uncharacterized protein LOC107171221 n=1 Tax=Diuraphis noxia TaxID=143948 RepID=UPI0007635C63|nr:PREDICTED: uncharacterized protein LOC107171221 [Diuraphis noxia]